MSKIRFMVVSVDQLTAPYVALIRGTGYDVDMGVIRRSLDDVECIIEWNQSVIENSSPEMQAQVSAALEYAYSDAESKGLTGRYPMTNSEMKSYIQDNSDKWETPIE